ncbi:MKI67 FHA domain-interacting nucleolar phosphoprotein [Achroia grisella]|uniref:MKI67 FHA domain-interacting nucleolar phosphoprotein n=1 Tax=Achroia grisella TaxID=688607 RepID=UPI0027D32539|nr:MKI67 FHA domain-interacting nucleolar phosphoprotein [Achroia grisella]
MEENVALDTSKQKQFVKSIKGIKKLIKKDKKQPDVAIKSKKPRFDKIKKKKVSNKGLVYLGHIPHGFYEHEMTEYFKQFGQVTNVRVIRSKRTGNSKGYGFVEFKDQSVAEIVADTMNNYLMGKRLIKAVVIPPEKQRKALRKNWNTINNPGFDARLKNKKAYNENKDEDGELKRATKILSNLTRTKKKLSELGINYDFFKPVDVPEVLLPILEAKQDEDVEIKKEEDNKKNKKNVKVEKENKDNKNKRKGDNLTVKVEEKPVKVLKIKEKKGSEIIGDKKQQNNKKDKLKKANVQPTKDFMKVEESTESDSSYQFDSDEYEKVMENEDEFNSDLSSNEEDDEESSNEVDKSDSDTEQSNEVVRIKSKTLKGPLVRNSRTVKNQVKEVIKQKKSNPEKRKVVESEPKAAPVGKKSKFEKQKNQKITKKQFKRKN